jgi:hypothetical protein
MTTGPSAITGPSMSEHDEIMTTDEVAKILRVCTQADAVPLDAAGNLAAALRGGEARAFEEAGGPGVVRR